MKCPHCGSEETRVYGKEKFSTVDKRRRECRKCLKVFMTREEVDGEEGLMPVANFKRQLKAEGSGA